MSQPVYNALQFALLLRIVYNGLAECKSIESELKVKHLTTMREKTAYQLSTELQADYRVVRAILEDFENQNVINVVGKSTKSHNAKIYGIDSIALSKIESVLQARKSKNESVQVAGITNDLQQLKDLQTKVNESEVTIKSLNDLIANKEKEIWRLTNEKTVAESDLKVIKAEMLLIEDKKKSLESAWAGERQEKEKLQAKIDELTKEYNNKLKTKNIIIGVISVVLLMALNVAILYFLR